MSLLSVKYYFLLLLALPFICLALKQYQRFNKAKLITHLRKKWGTAESGVRNFSDLQAYFRKTQSGDDNKYMLDDRTWNDLDMDSIYAQMDRTLTIPGELLLYSLLRRPLVNQEELTKRNCLINMFSQDQDVRE